MSRKLTVFSLFLLALAIALGAFGAHALKDMVGVKWQNAFETGIRYLFIGALFLLIISFQKEFQQKTYRGWIILFIVGILLFSCSIFLLVAGEAGNVNLRFAGPITPVGGLCMVVSMVGLGIRFLRNTNKEQGIYG